uniref:Uncharacterized protein n=1 Tax=Romanomermis culicivorax TaxID=13658 RepID=A0A915HFV4_ROMCU
MAASDTLAVLAAAVVRGAGKSGIEVGAWRSMCVRDTPMMSVHCRLLTSMPEAYIQFLGIVPVWASS